MDNAALAADSKVPAVRAESEALNASQSTGRFQSRTAAHGTQVARLRLRRSKGFPGIVDACSDPAVVGQSEGSRRAGNSKRRLAKTCAF